MDKWFVGMNGTLHYNGIAELPHSSLQARKRSSVSKLSFLLSARFFYSQSRSGTFRVLETSGDVDREPLAVPFSGLRNLKERKITQKAPINKCIIMMKTPTFCPMVSRERKMRRASQAATAMRPREVAARPCRSPLSGA